MFKKVVKYESWVLATKGAKKLLGAWLGVGIISTGTDCNFLKCYFKVNSEMALIKCWTSALFDKLEE